MQKSTLIRRALQSAGVLGSNDDSVPGDYYAPTEQILVSLIDELNSQPDIVFSRKSVKANIVGDDVKFNSSLSGQDIVSVDAAASAPVIYRGTDQYSLVTIEELYSHDGSELVFAYVQGESENTVLFPGSIGGQELRFVYAERIAYDSDPFGAVSVPANYQEYLTFRLAAKAAIHYQMGQEKANALLSEATGCENRVRTTNTAPRVVKTDVQQRLNRYA